MPKILFLGDIVGRPGRNFVIERVASLREEYGADIVIANAENSAGGAGMTKKIADSLIAAGVDAITLGDHVWDQKNFENEIDQLERVCRPANLPEQNPGRTHLIVEKDGFRLGILTVLGRNYLALKSSCPFRMADAKLEELKSQCDAVFVEAHMEATSEKIALGWHLDGRAAAVVGTHTHVPTADGRVLPAGTAYLSDAGMCGPYASVIGREVDQVVATFLDGMKRRFPVAEDDVRIAGCLIEVDASTGLSLSFQRVELAK
ncbi:TIGR00282 family metallophosphoesterase [Coraliomargarita sp. SDUM461003]|uniref:TIGR00282 family metallophosphoesterase n=1 Tax=Thalassobacterium maritimum TaxID=3041265 RepID=A0ABU1AYG9_9BACT|nr:TIGR00282 family metallophosphoesterase [Coraliomargarita sp. SDUM461003]MDQ8208160.1 TIGR00282 family metallophosphoesterase [Coraliomargarita sp. SDUM461003]